MLISKVWVDFSNLILHMKWISRYTRGDDRLSVEDWDTGEAVEIVLDPSLTAQEQTEGLYKKARKLRRTSDNVEPLLHQAALDLEHLQVMQWLCYRTTSFTIDVVIDTSYVNRLLIAFDLVIETIYHRWLLIP